MFAFFFGVWGLVFGVLEEDVEVAGDLGRLGAFWGFSQFKSCGRLGEANSHGRSQQNQTTTGPGGFRVACVASLVVVLSLLRVPLCFHEGLGFCTVVSL